MEGKTMQSIEKFKETLEKFNLNEQIISRINDGYENITTKSPKKIKAAYFKRALDILADNPVSP